MITIQKALSDYLASVQDARSENTHATYSRAVLAFSRAMAGAGIDIDKTSIGELNEGMISKFAKALQKDRAPATVEVYIQAMVGFFEYVAAEELASPNLPRLKIIIKQRVRKQGRRIPTFPYKDIEQVLAYAQELDKRPATKLGRIRNLRDRAFLLTLADTGLRVHEICNLVRSDIDFEEERATIIGKGDKQALVRFSHRSILAILDYLRVRSQLDGASGRPIESLPVFSRHDSGANQTIIPMETQTGRNIVAYRVRMCLGKDYEERITPHTFRHFFVTTVLRETGNLKVAQEFARHSNIDTTQRYSHLANEELDASYHGIFNSKRKKVPA